MEMLEKLVAFNLNYLIAGLMVLFYSLEYLFDNKFTSHWRRSPDLC
jgi:hypothetical protein